MKDNLSIFQGLVSPNYFGSDKMLGDDFFFKLMDIVENFLVVFGEI